MLVDLVTAYSNRSDLVDSLVRALEQLDRARQRGAIPSTSVRSTGRSDRQWRVADRLSEADARLLVGAFEHGTPKWKLAEQYGISESSVKRLLRKHRADQVVQLQADT